MLASAEYDPASTSMQAITPSRVRFLSVFTQYEHGPKLNGYPHVAWTYPQDRVGYPQVEPSYPQVELSYPQSLGELSTSYPQVELSYPQARGQRFFSLPATHDALAERGEEGVLSYPQSLGELSTGWAKVIHRSPEHPRRSAWVLRSLRRWCRFGA